MATKIMNCEICKKEMPAIDLADTRSDNWNVCSECQKNEIPHLVIFNRPGMPAPWGKSGGGACAFLRGNEIPCTDTIWRATARGAKRVDWGRCSKQEFEKNIAAYLAAG
jgi:hypothetical protein